MKVTRLMRGYSIRLNDTEFAALVELVEHGIAEFQGVDPHEKYGIPKRVANAMGGIFLRVTEDRRADTELLKDANSRYSSVQLEEMFDQDNRLRPGFAVSGA